MAFGKGRSSPLARILGQTFGEIEDRQLVVHKATRPDSPDSRLSHGPDKTLGGVMEERNASMVGNRPGITYAGGPQTQKRGLRGCDNEALMRRWAELFADKNPDRCGPIATPEAAEVVSYIMEQTFRNFQLTARAPSHINPPFSATCIEAFGSLNVPLVFVDVVTFTMPGRSRGVIFSIGQQLETAGAFADVEWRVTVNGIPLSQYAAFSYQLSSIPNVSPLCSPINLRGGDVVKVQARGIVLLTHTASARLFGWSYPVRVEMDHQIGSTLVD